MPTKERKPATLAGTVVDRSCHACAFFHNSEEQYGVDAAFHVGGFAE